MKALEYFDKLLKLKHTKEKSFLIQNRFAFAEKYAEHQNKVLTDEVKVIHEELRKWQKSHNKLTEFIHNQTQTTISKTNKK